MYCYHDQFLPILFITIKAETALILQGVNINTKAIWTHKFDRVHNRIRATLSCAGAPNIFCEDFGCLKPLYRVIDALLLFLSTVIYIKKGCNDTLI